MYSTCSKNASTDFKEEMYEEEMEPRIPSCLKLYLNNLTRRRLSGCYSENAEVLYEGLPQNKERFGIVE